MVGINDVFCHVVSCNAEGCWRRSRECPFRWNESCYKIRLAQESNTRRTGKEISTVCVDLSVTDKVPYDFELGDMANNVQSLDKLCNFSITGCIDKMVKRFKRLKLCKATLEFP